MSTQTYLGSATGCSTETLLDRARQGDQLAWRHLVEEYDGLVRSVARSFRLQAEDVHDVAQTTWLRLVQHLHNIREPERLAGWLSVTASHESLSVLRKASRHHLASEIENEPDPAVALETSAANRDAAR